MMNQGKIKLIHNSFFTESKSCYFMFIIIKRDNPDHMKRINSVTFEQIIQESKIPWERHLIPNKVLNVPYNYEEQRVKPKRRKSKMRRDAEKKGNK